ncbi:hypothetical protein AS888_24385 [Peribacillus simplex]|uniref:DUF4352 domain-containing protein n=1 Tax=Peribacillus simplex TaxID=1478 RepID=A0A109MVZ3_9BACI|nr:DUF5067 domain-containing protein [Peribacillus simplex]KWW16567.1 hypothetical protein AS888_24385 [Peribacillus simplex]
MGLKRSFPSIWICILTLTIFLTGCISGEKEARDEQKEMHKQTNASTNDETDKKETGQEKTVSGVSIEIEKALKLKHPDKKDKQVLQIQLKATNKTAEERHVDAFEMSVWNQDNKKLKIYPGDNLGTKLEPGKSVKGNGYYVLEGKGPFRVEYENTDTKEKQEWLIFKWTDMTAKASEKK